MRTQWFALAPLALLAKAISAQDTCSDVGLPKPSLVTLTVSPSNSNEAIILRPDCTHEVIKAAPTSWDPSSTDLEGSYKEIEQVESFPAVNRLLLIANHLKSADFSKDLSMTDLLIGWNALTSIDNFKFPANLRGLDLEGNSLSNIAKGVIPDSVSYLYLSSNKLTSLAGITMPASLKHLYLMSNELKSLEIPEGVISVTADSNPLSTFEKTKLPSTLEKLSCVGCGITTIRGVEFPATLTEFTISQSKVSNFEIRESDLAIFARLALDASTIVQSKCEDEEAIKVELKGPVTLCVITDERFNTKYRAVQTQPPVTEPPTTQPPATNPPTTEPPTTQPPATNPPTTEPPTSQPPTMKPSSPPSTTKPPSSTKPTNPPSTTEPPSPTKPSSPPSTTEPPSPTKPTNPPSTTAPPTTQPPTVKPSNPPTTTKPSNPPSSDEPSNPPSTTKPGNPPSTGGFKSLRSHVKLVKEVAPTSVRRESSRSELDQEWDSKSVKPLSCVEPEEPQPRQQNQEKQERADPRYLEAIRLRLMREERDLKARERSIKLAEISLEETQQRAGEKEKSLDQRILEIARLECRLHEALAQAAPPPAVATDDTNNTGYDIRSKQQWLEEREALLRLQEQEVQIARNRIAEREKHIATKERVLRDKASELNQLQTDLESKAQQRWKTLEKHVAQSEAGLHERYEHLEKELLGRFQSQLRDLHGEIDQKRGELDDFRAAESDRLRVCHQELVTQAHELSERASQLNLYEQSLLSRSKELQRKCQHTQWLAEHSSMACEDLAMRMMILESQRLDLRSRLEEVESIKQQTEQAEVSVRSKEHRLSLFAQEVEAQYQDNQRRQKELDDALVQLHVCSESAAPSQTTESQSLKPKRRIASTLFRVK
ncbi:hypothetical protein Poli38472_013848 [Pythium oligandrum]|uniref:Uncharacterized protein n=1 Tax=Pythium oligandrum TaxID=41045 RepID=A0A8K1C272_PYTOL|nr:hypothetical protein Poli38472_013848 [Pythium oligandrum]|eukprot:TMW55086.1 hypothetical protein Poli38472_013848 [Pythium oligandrum]